jgi:hypothetical protein
MSLQSNSVPASLSGHSAYDTDTAGIFVTSRPGTASGRGSGFGAGGVRVSQDTNPQAGGDVENGGQDAVSEKPKRVLFGRKKAKRAPERPIRMFAPIYNGLAAALSICEI